MLREIFFLGIVVAGTLADPLSFECLGCMCYVSSQGCFMSDPVCHKTPEGVEVCGPWAITEPYWIDANRPGKFFHTCVESWDCNEEAVRNYLNRYAASTYATCETYARVHFGGPSGASADYTLDYWYKVEKCLENGYYTPPPK
ncbi:invertebrate-type lysozyme-like [Oratosquilla oratoria]|uniref:invertebrate-type lysozyme-like n=1 Tax=Oratosquilla oratoria TaxID=337810 RepID=UPI003F76C39A